MKRLIVWLAAVVLATVGGQAGLAQTFAVSSISTSNNNFGTIVAARTGTTVLRAAASSGIVTTVSGNGILKSAPSVRSLVTVVCSGAAGVCNGASVQITISAGGTANGRTAALKNFTASAVSPATGSGSGTGGSLTFTLANFGNGSNATRTFNVGYDFTVNGDDTSIASGSVNSAFTVTAGTSSLSSTAVATVLRSIAITKTADMSFGRIVRPRTGLDTITLAAGTGAVTTGGTAKALTSPAPTAAAFSISGEGGQAVTVSVPATITLTGPGSSITVKTTTSGITANLGGSVGAAGTMTPKVGGSFTLPSNQASGAYSGTFSVTVQYP